MTPPYSLPKYILSRSLRFALALGAAVFGFEQAQADSVRLANVSVHLLLEKTGGLSPDLMQLRDLYSWNSEPSGTGIPEGERFDAILIKVRLVSDREVFARGEQARVTVSASGPTRVLRDEHIQGVYIGPERTATKFIFVGGVSCTPIVVKVTAGAKSFSKALPFNCGE